MKHAEARCLKKAFDQFALAGWALGNALALTAFPDARDWVVSADAIAAIVLVVNGAIWINDWRKA